MAGSERHHAAILFPSVVLLFPVQAALAIYEVPSQVLAIPLSATLVASIWSLDPGGRWFRLGSGLALGVLLAFLGHSVSGGGLVVVLFSGLIALATISVSLGVRWLFGAARITARTLLSAVSVYLLIAVTFSLVYALLYYLEPEVFRGVSPTGNSVEMAELMYYSIGCLSSSAFGEILPAHPVTRILANAESVAGQLYMAVLVAILITGYAAPADRER